MHDEARSRRPRLGSRFPDLLRRAHPPPLWLAERRGPKRLRRNRHHPGWRRAHDRRRRPAYLCSPVSYTIIPDFHPGNLGSVKKAARRAARPTQNERPRQAGTLRFPRQACRSWGWGQWHGRRCELPLEAGVVLGQLLYLLLQFDNPRCLEGRAEGNQEAPAPVLGTGRPPPIRAPQDLLSAAAPSRRRALAHSRAVPPVVS
jgi:hypothetical protein